jgi:hypothetical protein
MATKDDQEPKKRRGKAVKAKRGEHAEFQPGTAAGPKNFDPSRIANELHLWWEDGDGTCFIVGQNPKMVKGNGEDLLTEAPQTWSEWPEKKIVNLMRLKYVKVKARDEEILSEAERVLLYTMEHRRLSAAVRAIPGYSAGMYQIQGERFLVRTSPQLVEFKPGEWPTVRALIEGKLDLLDDEGHGITQAVYFHAWMKKSIEALYLGGPGNFQSGPCLVFAGAGDVGKSRIQHQIITPMLGGRSADPSAYLFGKSDFNSEIFAAEHVMMEEIEQTSSKHSDRVLFGERVKKLVSSDRQRMHAKREDALMVEPFFRMTISLNNDPDKLRLLFLLTPDMRDKVMLFLVSNAPLPMPAITLEERKAFRDKVTSELPAYGHWLMNEFEIPENLKKGRWGIACWHHPQLAMELFDDTPAAELLQIIDAAEFWSGGDEAERYKLWELKSHGTLGETWEGSAIELEKLLVGEGSWVSSVARDAKKVAMHNKIDRLLSRLREDQGERVVQHRTRIERRWIVTKPVA